MELKKSRSVMFNMLATMLPERQQITAARWRFQKVREDFYRETRLDIAAKGLRNTETLFDRLETYEKRNRARGRIEWRVFARIRETMQRGEGFAHAIKPFIPGDEYALFDIADESSREDAVVRGFELAEIRYANDFHFPLATRGESSKSDLGDCRQVLVTNGRSASECCLFAT